MWDWWGRTAERLQTKDSLGKEFFRKEGEARHNKLDLTANLRSQRGWWSVPLIKASLCRDPLRSSCLNQCSPSPISLLPPAFKMFPHRAYCHLKWPFPLPCCLSVTFSLTDYSGGCMISRTFSLFICTLQSRHAMRELLLTGRELPLTLPWPSLRHLSVDPRPREVHK